MGVNCTGVEQIIHFGPPNDIYRDLHSTNGKRWQGWRGSLLFTKAKVDFVIPRLVITMITIILLSCRLSATIYMYIQVHKFNHLFKYGSYIYVCV